VCDTELNLRPSAGRARNRRHFDSNFDDSSRSPRYSSLYSRCSDQSTILLQVERTQLFLILHHPYRSTPRQTLRKIPSRKSQSPCTILKEGTRTCWCTCIKWSISSVCGRDRGGSRVVLSLRFGNLRRIVAVTFNSTDWLWAQRLDV